MPKKSSLLLIGDSFGAPASMNTNTWYSNLDQSFYVENRAQAGVGQYKIRQQLLPNDKFDVCILLVTSEYRIHCTQNPFYPDLTHPHHNCDLIFGDIESRVPDNRAEHITWWFSEIFDLNHARYQHSLVLKDTAQSIQKCCKKLIPITFFKPYNSIYDFHGQLIDLSWVHKKHPGDINHLSNVGHNKVWKILEERLA
jgi:hypothetical protein